MIHMKYIPTQDYSFLLDENHYVYDHVEEEDSLHIYIKSKEHYVAILHDIFFSFFTQASSFFYGFFRSVFH